MRAGLSTVQQTLTPEAATILNQSIAEACHHSHGQTTPLHVAATLQASPSGFLRQACSRSHPKSSHPLQCRALELCFSVALDRLPTAQNMAPGFEPPLSNALMAALKRAQAQQRRGCPEQKQQPLLAVKVELDQLVVSILDDPSVSRVMREAGFSSPAVKAAIEQSLNSSNSHGHQQHHIAGVNVNYGPRMLPNPGQLTAPVMQPSPPVALVNRNPYLNPRLQSGPAGETTLDQMSEKEKRVVEIMVRSKKRNPILVGDSEPEGVVKELLRKIENQELGHDGIFKNVQVVSMEKGVSSEKNYEAEKIKELGEVIESRIVNGGVILDLGDLKWLVVHQLPPEVAGMGRTAVVEMSKLFARFRRDSNKLWLIGSATCETYLRCQVYHSTMENDWDLQAVPVPSRSPLPVIFSRFGSERHLSNPMEPFNPIRAAPTRRLLENRSPSEKTTFCPQCSENYGKEVAKLTAIHKSFCRDPQPSLPQWLQNAKLNSTDAKIADHSHGKVNELLSKQKTKELQKKWRDLCLHLHPHFHQCNRTDRPAPPTLLMTSLYNPNVLREKPLGEGLQLNTDWACSKPGPVSPPGSPVRTDLVLGRKGTQSTAEKDVENRVKDFLGCISSEPHTKLLDKFSNALDADVYKKLLKGLMVRAWWQAEAASMVALAITRCRLGNGKRWGGGSRGDIWLLFAGPDRVGKKKMATAIAEHTCGVCPIMICLGAQSEEPHTNFRGKTAIDRIAEAIRRNPFSVIMLQDIDESDVLVRGNIKRAMERGRIADSHGREVSLRNAVFILMGDWSSGDCEASEDGHFVDEKKLASVASGNWQLGLIVREKTSKRRPSWLLYDDDDDHDRPVRPRKELGPGRSLDLNVDAVEVEDYQTDGSHNPSSLTIDHEGSLVDRHFSVTSVPQDLVNNVEDSIMFKPVDPALVQWEIKKTISLRFSTMVDENVTLEIEDDVLERILGALWHDETSLEEWVRQVLEPSFDRLKLQLPSGVSSSWVVRMVVKADSSSRGSDKGGDGDWLPSSILV